MNTTLAPAVEAQAEISPSRRASVWRTLARSPSVLFGVVVLVFITLVGLAAPILHTTDPAAIDPANRNKRPGYEATLRNADGTTTSLTHWMGTDSLGRDVYSRVVYGARVSLLIGVAVAAASISIGLFIGLLVGYFRLVDNIVMRVMDGMMAIPAILLALSLVSLLSAGLTTVIIAISITEIPRVVRLVRSVVLSVREEPYVEAAISVGTPTWLLLIRHVLPNTISPLIVQATYIAAHAILIEAVLSFLGVGIPADTPTWGNIMAEGRALFRLFPHNIFYPGLFLALSVLAVNILGDGLRDALDPRMRERA